MPNEFNINTTIEMGEGLNKYQLLQSESRYVTAIYESVFKQTEGSLTTVIDNDAISKFKVAISKFSPNSIQCNIIEKFKEAFRDIETEIDPDRLTFNITKAFDGEICINRVSRLGLSKIIINEDGIIALSFVSFKGVQKNDTLSFSDYSAETEYELITFNFLSL